MQEVTLQHRKISEKMSQQSVPTISKKTLDSLEKNLDLLEKEIPKSNLINELLGSQLKERFRALESAAEGIGEVDAEKRKPKVNPSAVRPLPKGEKVRNPTQARQKKKFWYINLPTGRIKLIHNFVSVDGNPPKMYFSEFNENASPPEFIVSTNTEFKGWGITKDEVFYTTNVVIIALSKLIEGMTEQKKATALDIQEELWGLLGKAIHRQLEAEQEQEASSEGKSSSMEAVHPVKTV